MNNSATGTASKFTNAQPARSGARKRGGFAFSALVVAGILVSVPQPAMAAPNYYPSGPQNDVLISDVTSAGWEICYQGTYVDSKDLYGAGGLISELCTGDYLMLAGSKPSDLTKYAVLAAAPRENVLFDTGKNGTTTHLANGTNWYFNPDWSWGYVDAGETPSKSSCDTSSYGKPKSLCWHTSLNGGLGQLFFGYLLAGESGLNSANTHIRVVLQPSSMDQAPAPDPAPEPYRGPMPTNYSDLNPSIGDEVRISGRRLNLVESCSIDGVTVVISDQSADSFTILIPEGLEPGLKDLVMTGPSGKLTALRAFAVESKPLPSTESPQAVSQIKAESFKGFVAVNAMGHKGKTLAWKIAGKWFKTTVTSDKQVFQRKTAANGLDVFVHLYINGEKQLTKTVTTR